MTATERMMDWVGIGWRHILPLSFIYTLVIAIYCAWMCVDDVRVIGFKFYKYAEDKDKTVTEWSNLYGPIFAVLIIPLLGFPIIYMGRYAVLMIFIILCVCLTPLSFWANDAVLFGAQSRLITDFFPPIFIGIGIMFVYENLPVQYRRMGVLVMGIFASIGKLSYSLVYQMGEADYILSASDYVWKDAVLWSSFAFLLPVIIGILLHRDTPISLVDRGYESQVYEEFIKIKKSAISSGTTVVVNAVGTATEGGMGSSPPTTSTYPPMCKTEYQFQIEVERINALKSFKHALIRKWKSLLFLLITCNNVQLAEQIFLNSSYVYAVYQYFADGDYNGPMVKGLVYQNFFAILGIILALIVLGRFKRIAMLPGVSALLIAIGAAVVSPVKLWNPEDNYARYSTNDIPIKQVLAGVTITTIGLGVAEYVQYILILELTPGKYRPVFVMIQMGVKEMWNMIARLLIKAEPKATRTQLFIAIAVVLFVIALAHLFVMYFTKWFHDFDPAATPTNTSIKTSHNKRHSQRTSLNAAANTNDNSNNPNAAGARHARYILSSAYDFDDEESLYYGDNTDYYQTYYESNPNTDFSDRRLSAPRDIIYASTGLTEGKNAS